MIKKLTVTVILIVITSLAVAGCTTPTPGTSPSPSATPDSHLARYVEEYTQSSRALHPNNMTTWRVTWNNSTAVQIQAAYTYQPPIPNTTTTFTYAETSTVLKFGSADDASQYAKSHASGYRLTRTNCTNATATVLGLYTRAMGHRPTVCTQYINGSRTGQYVEQYNEFVWVGNFADYLTAV